MNHDTKAPETCEKVRTTDTVDVGEHDSARIPEQGRFVRLQLMQLLDKIFFTQPMNERQQAQKVHINQAAHQFALTFFQTVPRCPDADQAFLLFRQAVMLAQKAIEHQGSI